MLCVACVRLPRTPHLSPLTNKEYNFGLQAQLVLEGPQRASEVDEACFAQAEPRHYLYSSGVEGQTGSQVRAATVAPMLRSTGGMQGVRVAVPGATAGGLAAQRAAHALALRTHPRSRQC